MVAFADSVKLPIEACHDTSRSPAPQRLSARKPEPSSFTGPANTGPNLPWVSLPETSMRFLPGSVGLEMLDLDRAVAGGERDIEIADEIAAKARLIELTASVASPTSAASLSTFSANR